MKTLKFFEPLPQMILDNQKTCTWRFFDDKDIQVGDEIEFFNRDSQKVFGRGCVSSILLKKFKEIDDNDLFGHEKFKDRNDMFDTYKKYYGDALTWESEVKIIRFSFKASQNN